MKDLQKARDRLAKEQAAQLQEAGKRKRKKKAKAGPTNITEAEKDVAKECPVFPELWNLIGLQVSSCMHVSGCHKSASTIASFNAISR